MLERNLCPVKGDSDGQDENLVLSPVTKEDQQTDENLLLVKKKKKKKNTNGKQKKVIEVEKKDDRIKQIVPPSIPINQLFPNGDYPIGELMDYPKVEHDK